MTFGDVVLLKFPFSDLTGAKLRPAVILAEVGRHEIIACQITSKRKSDAATVELSSRSFEVGGLRIVGFVRPTKLSTAHENIVVRRVARLKQDVAMVIRESVIKAIRQG